MPKKSPSSPPSPVDDESRAGLAFDRTLDRREASAAAPAAAAAPSVADPVFAPTLEGSNPPRKQVAAAGREGAAPGPVAGPAAAEVDEVDQIDPTVDVPASGGQAKAAAEGDDEEDEEESGSTRSIGAVRSGAAASAPRSAPSVPYVGIPRSLQKWDRYEVQSVLGAGGMGAVYKARDPRLNRMVALKIIHPMLGQNDDTRGEGVVRRFLREARLQASLEHPHICKIPEGCRNSDGIA